MPEPFLVPFLAEKRERKLPKKKGAIFNVMTDEIYPGKLSDNCLLGLTEEKDKEKLKLTSKKGNWLSSKLRWKR